MSVFFLIFYFDRCVMCCVHRFAMVALVAHFFCSRCITQSTQYTGPIETIQALPIGALRLPWHDLPSNSLETSAYTQPSRLLLLHWMGKNQFIPKPLRGVELFHCWSYSTVHHANGGRKKMILHWKYTIRWTTNRSRQLQNSNSNRVRYDTRNIQYSE